MKAKIAYIPLTTKYRPQTLDAVVGQQVAVQQIEGMLQSGRIDRSLLISGIRGSGKTTLARIIARHINCQNPQDGWRLCGDCRSCRTADHPDIIEINAANQRGIDDMRALVVNSQYAPTTNFRVFILDELHQATSQALQMLLKPLEEPSRRTIFILATTNPEKLPDTILSRCQHIVLKEVQPVTTAKLLQRIAKAENRQIDKAVCLEIGQAVRGVPRDAIRALEAVFNFMDARGQKVMAADAAELVPQMLDNVVRLTPKKAITACLTSIYRGRYTKALLAVKLIDDREHLVRTLLDWHLRAMFHTMSAEKLLDKFDLQYYEPLFAAMGDQQIELKIETAAKITEIMTMTLSQVVDHKLDAYYLALAMVLKCVKAVNDESSANK